MNSWRELIQGDAGKDDVEHFRVISRHGADFLVLPAEKALAVEGLSIYPAQTTFAKAARRGLGIALKMNLAVGQNRVSFPVNRRGWLGILLGRSPVAILCGNPSAKGRRFVFLGFENGRPCTIAKVGLGEHAAGLIAREAVFLREATGFAAVPSVRRDLQEGQLRALSMDFIPGSSPSDSSRVFDTLLAWIRPEKVPLGSLPGWATIVTFTGREALRITAKAIVSPVLYHGDFAPWNIREHHGKWTVIDWERGEMRGIPGWDWLHFVIQTEVMVRKTPAAKVFAKIQQLFHSPAWTKYATLTGIVDLSNELLVAYLINALDIVGQTEGVGILRELLRHAGKKLN